MFDMDYSFNKSTLFNKHNNGADMSIIGICKNQLVFIEKTEFGVYSFESMDDEYFKIQGIMPIELISGQTYKIIGKITTYKDEKQIRINQVIPCKPVNRKGIIAYLQTLYGLKSKANLIYDKFGDECINMLIKDPLLVAKEIIGIGKKSVVKWQVQLKLLEDNQENYIRLLEYGISTKNASKLLEKYGEEIILKIEENPFILMKEVKGYGFIKCDKIAMEMGIAPNSPHRIKSGINYTLEDASLSGHCFLPLDELIKEVKNNLDIKLSIIEMNSLYKTNISKKNVLINKYNEDYNVDLEIVKTGIDNYYNEKKQSNRINHNYCLVSIDESDIANQINDLISTGEVIYNQSKVYLPNLYNDELGFAEKIKKIAKYDIHYNRKEVEKVLDKICKQKGYELEKKQRDACIEFNLCKSGVYILRGAAGTGKTFVLNLILEVGRILQGNKQKILAVAPTGKASKVASKSIGMLCSTIHKALEFSPMNGFQKDEFDKFEQNVIVCDESSMLDISLGFSFIKAIKIGSKIILMGDTHQLPSIGAGNVLHDLIESGVVTVVTLDVLKRQGLLSGIAKNANRIIDCKMIKSELDTNDFFFLERTGISSIQTTTLKCVERLLTYPGYTLDDIQILLPQRTGSLGVNIFNLLMQEKFNKTSSDAKILKLKFDAKMSENSSVKTYELFIKETDKVMHIKNNYEMKLYEKDSYGEFKELESVGITNGECGVVESITKVSKSGLRIIVKYEDYYVFYDDGIEELELCYATTIHKSQGSAWRAIIMPVVPQHINMLSNNLLYTGVTRARDFVSVISDTKTMYLGINTHEVTERYTTLQERLNEVA